MRKGIAVVICGLSSGIFGSAGCAYGREETALDRYVAAFDLTHHYELLNTVAGDGYVVNVLEMTSQQCGRRRRSTVRSGSTG
jgi:hypothetical protein